MNIRISICALMLLVALPASAQPVALVTHEADFVVHNFQFRSGETLPDLRLHYTTLGKPVRDAHGRITNAVLLLHGTSRDGHQFLQRQFSDVLFVPGGLLDVTKYFIVLPDGIGSGKSSKPSDGLHARFPSYDYDDMVIAQYLLLTEGLKVDHLRLLLGTSMGCMHAFVWGETYSNFMDALMPLACLPVQIAGRNRIWRKMSMDAIKADPAWKGGDYTMEPLSGLRAAADFLVIVFGAPLEMQKLAPNRDAADNYAESTISDNLATIDANDYLYKLNASRNYDPSAALDKIVAPVMWVNTADDFINPPELRIAEDEVKKLKKGKFVLIPVSSQTRGHGTHTWAAVWKDYLAELLKISAH